MGNGVEIQGVKEILEKWEIDHVEQVIDILEGTMPAFELRRMKYTYNLYGNY